VGVFILGVALLLLMFYSIMAILSGLVLVCLGFFTIHTVAFGSLNRRLSGGQGRANALYVLLYYMGGWVGITWSGYAYEFGGWSAVIYSALAILIVPLMAGLGERRTAGHR
jgi:YNFM family putative membrane transporter